jgi:hypothetical protein
MKPMAWVVGGETFQHLFTVLAMGTGPTDQDQYYFVQTSKFVTFYLEIHKNEFKNLIWTSKFKFAFQELD